MRYAMTRIEGVARAGYFQAIKQIICKIITAYHLRLELMDLQIVVDGSALEYAAGAGALVETQQVHIQFEHPRQQTPIELPSDRARAAPSRSKRFNLPLPFLDDIKNKKKHSSKFHSL